jgi:hypothetical protein
MGLNISVDFKKLGGFPALTDPGPATGSQVNRNYDNGYNRVDSSGNTNNQTWFWGYDRASSIQGGNLVLDSSSSPATAVSKNREDDPQHGMELSYSRQFYRHDPWRAGLEAAIGYTHIGISDGRTLFAEVNRTTDTFSLGGIVPPLAPYHGTFSGPGPVISSSPDRAHSVIDADAIIVGKRDLDADLFALRLGPYFQFPIYKKLSGILNGGLTLAVGRTDFSFRETVTIADAGLTSAPRRSSGSQTDFLVGGYAGAALSYELTRAVSLFCGAQFQAAGRAVNHEAGKVAILDLGQSIILSFGAGYSF